MPATPINLWLLKHQPNSGTVDTLLTRLPTAQRLRAKRYKGKRLCEFVLSRHLLTHALVQHNNEANAVWRIEEREQLPPQAFIGKNQFTTAISHSNGWVAVICTPSSPTTRTVIGLDIEMVSSRLHRANAEYFCNDRQLDKFDSLSDEPKKQRYLIQLWTQKEAYFKAHHKPILNAQTKTLSFDSFANGMPDNFSGLLLNAAVSDNFELSVYSREIIHLKPQFVTIKHGGEIAHTSAEPLVWRKPLKPNII